MIYLLMFVNFFGIMAVDMFLPALPAMELEFATTRFMTQLSIIATFWGTSFFRLLWGKLIAGRGYRYVGVTAALLIFAGHVFCYFAASIEVFIFGRFIMAVGNGSTYIIVGSRVAELYEGKDRASNLGLMEMSFPTALFLSPIVGAWITEYSDWRNIFLLLLIVQLISHVVLVISLPKQKQNSNNANTTITYSKMLRCIPFLITILLPAMVIGNYAQIFSTAPFIYIREFMLTPTSYSLYQAAPLIVSMLGLSIYRLLLKKFSITNILWFGMLSYLVFALVTGCILLLNFNLTPFLMAAFVSAHTFCQAFLVSPLIYNASAMYKDNQASAFALLAFVRGLIFGLAVLLAATVYNNSYQSILASMIVVCGVVFSLVALNQFLEPKLQRA